MPSEEKRELDQRMLNLKHQLAEERAAKQYYIGYLIGITAALDQETRERVLEHLRRLGEYDNS